MNTKKGCLIIHGFGGNYDEIRPLAERLEKKSFKVVCPALKGHTGRRQDLKGIKYQDWILSAEEGLKDLLTQCQEVYLIGFSMGGLISLNLATRYPISGVITLNSPIYYWDIKRIVLNIMEDIKLKKLEHTWRYISSSKSFPLSALINFRVLLSNAKKILSTVTCPVLVAQALEDDTVRKNSAEYIYRTVSSTKKTIRYYENSGHLILWSGAADLVIKDVIDFCSN